MKIILLAGGLGTRVSKLYPNIPKPMIEFGGKPFINYLVDWLKRNHFKEKDIIISAGYKSEKIILNFLGKEIKFSTEDKQLGTSGALYKVFLERLIKDDSEYFFVLNADSFCDIKLMNVFMSYLENTKFKNKDSIGGIVVKKVNDASRYGTVVFDSSYKIKQFKEKENIKNSYINTGIYIFHKDIKNYLLQEGSLEKQVFNKLFDLYAIPVEGEFIDIGTEESINELRKDIDKWVEILKS
jgi:D-glycero-alpha-D-manno-heptose 1-phosphate guanylyltransferase